MAKKKTTQRELTPIEKQVQAIMQRRQDFALQIAFSELALELEKTDKLIEQMDGRNDVDRQRLAIISEDDSILVKIAADNLSASLDELEG